MVRIPFFEVDEVQQLLFILHFSHISSKKDDHHLVVGANTRSIVECSQQLAGIPF